MPSIIGATRLLKYKRQRAKKSKAGGEYKRRNEELPFIGYGSCAEYLASDEWKEIRAKVLRQYPKCSCCGRPASQVHHHSYEARVLLGLLNEMLFPICDDCHKKVEFLPDGRKRFFNKVRRELESMLLPAHRSRLASGIVRGDKLDREAERNRALNPPRKARVSGKSVDNLKRKKSCPMQCSHCGHPVMTKVERLNRPCGSCGKGVMRLIP